MPGSRRLFKKSEGLIHRAGVKLLLAKHQKRLNGGFRRGRTIRCGIEPIQRRGDMRIAPSRNGGRADSSRSESDTDGPYKGCGPVAAQRDGHAKAPVEEVHFAADLKKV
ncbi:MAG: hypothetical protein AAYR33_10330 [Acetobacteraceae bacterium]